jgi:hypothetical protein
MATTEIEFKREGEKKGETRGVAGWGDQDMVIHLLAVC